MTPSMQVRFSYVSSAGLARVLRAHLDEALSTQSYNEDLEREDLEHPERLRRFTATAPAKLRSRLGRGAKSGRDPRRSPDPNGGQPRLAPAIQRQGGRKADRLRCS